MAQPVAESQVSQGKKTIKLYLESMVILVFVNTEYDVKINLLRK